MNVKLDTLVRFEARAGAQDPVYGTVATTWTAFATVWAELADIAHTRSQEVISAGVRIAHRPTRIRMRFRSDITSDMRVVDLRSGRVMALITPPVTLGQREWLEILATDYSTQGDVA